MVGSALQALWLEQSAFTGLPQPPGRQRVQVQPISENHNSLLRQSLRLYQMELFGRLLTDRLQLSLPLIWVLLVTLYFGVLLILHRLVGTPAPARWTDIFAFRPDSYYYPNIIALTYDIIGNPLLLVSLLLNRQNIPEQLTRLRKSGFIREVAASGSSDRLRRVATDETGQRVLMVVVPTIVAFLGLLLDISVNVPTDGPQKYAVVLSAVGRYARVASFVQIAYVFVVLANHHFDFRLHCYHPDGCSGLAPFGRLSLVSYAYLFLFAMLEAAVIPTKAAGIRGMLTNVAGASAVGYLWVLFPLSVVFVFVELIYRPHRALEATRSAYLVGATRAWTGYHLLLAKSIPDAERMLSLPSASREDIRRDFTLLEEWAKFNAHVARMPTWPVPMRDLRAIGILANPLLPMVLPLLTQVLSAPSR
jgi:hypothetical protein